MAFPNGTSNGSAHDLIDLWLEYTEGLQSPPIFRLWSGIALVAGALERRVWAAYGDYVTYPNFYTMLVAPPGVGKYVIEHVRDVWREVQMAESRLPAFHVGSDSVSKASLVDELSGAKQVRLTPDGPPMVYNSLLIAAEELSVFMPAYDPEFVGILNGLFNNRTTYTESRRTSVVKRVSILNPTLNLLVGTQPAQLASRFPDDVWNTGIARRLLMIYAPEGTRIDIFAERPQTEGRRKRIVDELSALATMFGLVRWHKEAFDRVRGWYLAGEPPVPDHSKLVNYVRSRTMFLVKLAIIAAVAARGELVIRLDDVDRALSWLLDAEMVMPGIFRDMIGKSDRDVINELHGYVAALWKKDRQKPVIGASLRQFLVDRAPAERVERIIEVAERSHIIIREAVGTDLWRPGQRGGQVE